MRSLLASLLPMMLLAPLAGCSLLIDTDPYVGGGAGDGGPDTGVVDTDGGDRDAMVDPNGPSAPEVAIAPETPLTADDLVASITTDSVDPLDTGAVTYEWSWTVDGAGADETGMTIAADRTEKDQVWTVSVTPVASDGRRGAAGTASVTIANSPPTVDSVRLGTYRPIVGEVLIAHAGSTSDPDDDAVGLRFAWYLNDALIPGEVSNRLESDDLTIEPGDRIHVELTSRDPSGDGNTVRAGPAIVLTDETRWRQLLPHRTWETAHLVAHDPLNDRVLLLYATEEDYTGVRVWEYTLDGTAAFTELFPTGPEPQVLGAAPIWDGERQRLLIVGGREDRDLATGAVDVFALDVSQRGGEIFTQINPLGEAPPTRLYPTVALDAERSQLLLYGGIVFEDGGGVPTADFWTLDLTTTGGEIWTEQLIPLPPVTVVGGALVVDTARDRALLVTGGEFSEPGEPPPSMTIYTLDLTDLPSGFLSAGTIPSGGRFFATAALDAAADRILIGYGVAPGDVFLTDWFAVDLETLITSTLALDGEGAEFGGNGVLAPRGDTFVLYPGLPFGDGTAQFDLFEVDLASSTITPLHQTGVDLPPGLQSAAAGDRNRFTIIGGEDHRGEIRAEVWRLDGDELVLVDVLPDALDGTTPGPRAGLILQGSSPWGQDLRFMSGRLDENGEVLADSEVWHLDDTRWVHNTLTPGESAPPPRHAHATYRVACGNTYFGIVGGLDSSGNYLGDHHELSCTGDRSCRWESISSGLTPRADATAARLFDESFVLLYGGEVGFVVVPDLLSYRLCSGASATWVAAEVMGTPPPGRAAHVMVAREDFSSGALEQHFVFGGRDSGGRPLSDVHFLTVLGTAATSPERALVRWDPIPLASGPNDAAIPGREHAMAGWSEGDQRLLVYGGYSRGEVLSDLWELRYRAP